MRRVPPEVLFPTYKHQKRRCRCVAHYTADHPDTCHCWACGQRREWEADYWELEAREANRPIPTDEVAAHLEQTGLPIRVIAARLGVALDTASRLKTPGNRVRRPLVERALREL